MIRIIATFSVRADAVDQFIARAGELVASSLAEEGNVSYELLQSRQDPTVLSFLEGWADDAAIEAHNASPHFTTLVPALVELCDAEPSITQYEAV